MIQSSSFTNFSIFFNPQCDVKSVIYDAYENARFLCDQYYMTCPKLVIQQHNGRPIDSRRRLTR